MSDELPAGTLFAATNAYFKRVGRMIGSRASTDLRQGFEDGFEAGWAARGATGAPRASTAATRHPGQPPRPFPSLGYAQQLAVLRRYVDLHRDGVHARWAERGRGHVWAAVLYRLSAFLCDASTWDLVRRPYPPTAEGEVVR